MTKSKYYISLCLKYKKLVLIGLLLTLLNSILIFNLPFALNEVLTNLLNIKKLSFMITLKKIFIYSSLLLFQIILNYFSAIVFKKVGNSFSKEIIKEVINKISYAIPTNPSQYKIGDAIVVLSSDIFSIGESGITLAYSTLYIIINILSLIYYMLKTNLILFGITFLIFLIAIIIQKKLNIRITKCIENGRNASADFSYLANSIASNSRGYQKNDCFSYFNKIISIKLSELLDRRLEFTSLAGINKIVGGLSILLNNILIYSIGGYFCVVGKLLVGSLITFNMYSSNFGAYLNSIPNLIMGFKEFEVSYKRVEKFINLKCYENDINTKLNVIVKNIQFDNVSFGYLKNYMLINNFTFKFEVGKIYCIIGENGVGKSTILDLINGEYKINKGNIKINGKDIDLFSSKRSLEKIVNYCSAESILFNDTIMNNLLVDHDIQEKNISKVCEMLYLDEWINQLKDGYQTLIDDLKNNLSDGQKQKIHLARTLLNSKNIMIFDEIEKHLDEKTKKSVMEFLGEIKNEKLIIIVSHDQFVIEMSDDIVKII